MKEWLEKIADCFVRVMQGIICLSLLSALLVSAVESAGQCSGSCFFSARVWARPLLLGTVLLLSFGWIWGGMGLIQRLVATGRRRTARCCALLLLPPVCVWLLGLPSLAWGLLSRGGNARVCGAVALAFWLWMLWAVLARFREPLEPAVRQQLAQWELCSRLSFDMQRVACGVLDALRAPLLGLLMLLKALVAYGLPLFCLLLLVLSYATLLSALAGMLSPMQQQLDTLGDAASWQMLGLACLCPVLGYATAGWLAENVGKPLRALDVVLVGSSLLLACAAPCCLWVLVRAWLAGADWQTLFFPAAAALHFLLPLAFCRVEKARRVGRRAMQKPL